MQVITRMPCLAAAVMGLALSGCAGSGSSGAPRSNSARIVGDLGSCSGSQAVAMTIRSVDGSSTVSGQPVHLEGEAAPCTYPTYFDVPPGFHVIGVAYTAGDEVQFGSFTLTAKLGVTYDVTVHASGTSYWFEAKPRVQ